MPPVPLTDLLQSQYFEGEAQVLFFHGLPPTVMLKRRLLRQRGPDGQRVYHYKLDPMGVSMKAPDGCNYWASNQALKYLLQYK